MTSGRDIVVVSSVEWDFLWQGHHELASRLSRAGNRVVYVENMGVRSPRVADAGRIASRLRHWLDSLRSGGVRRVGANLYACSPLVLPPFGPPWRRALNRRLLRLVRRTVRGLGMRDPVVWTFLPTDTALDLIALLRTASGVVVYTCVADFRELTPHREALERCERELLALSDLVFAYPKGLADHCARWAARVHLAPSGVNLDAFPHGADGGGIAWLRELPRPVIGYVGGLHRHLNLPLAAAMARARPNWSWVYVGPAQVPVEELAACPNVRLAGHVPHPELAAYIDAFDVCIVPYRLGPETDAVVPTKVNEYLAMGKPVVSTRLPEVCNFNARHRVLRTAADNPEAFLAAVEEQLAPADGEVLRARRAAVASRDWATQVAWMSELLESAAAEKASGP